MNRDALIRRLVKHESLRTKVYDDATGKPLKPGDTLIGNPTIGIGRELASRGLSEDEAVILCGNDVLEAERGLDALCAWWRQLDETRQQVLAEMAFNLGAPRLMGFVKFLAALKAHDFETAAIEMLSSRWAQQVGDRAKTLADAMRTGRFINVVA